MPIYVHCTIFGCGFSSGLDMKRLSCDLNLDLVKLELLYLIGEDPCVSPNKLLEVFLSGSLRPVKELIVYQI